ncbi:ArsR/SmtB family transcription factor [Streptomyces niveus]|uniref:ArsR/SmtB family transcription factor n=1 Tax=Streptomyces niveus TaxID=193462 RepID=UPI003676BE3B
MAEPDTRRSRNLVHTDPTDVTLQDALNALADPVRRSILRECAGEPDFSRACGTFDLPVSKATASHHFAVLRAAGLLEQVDKGSRRLNRLRQTEFDARFPGLLALVLTEGTPPRTGPAADTGRPPQADGAGSKAGPRVITWPSSTPRDP